MRLAGLSKTGIIAASALAFSLVVGAANAGKMYWPSIITGQIHRANLDGTGEESLGISFVAFDNTLVLDVQGGKMYWPSGSNQQIHREGEVLFQPREHGNDGHETNSLPCGIDRHTAMCFNGPRPPAAGCRSGTVPPGGGAT